LPDAILVHHRRGGMGNSRVLKNVVHPSTKLRTNGGWIEIIGEFPFVLRLSKHECLFSAT